MVVRACCECKVCEITFNKRANGRAMPVANIRPESRPRRRFIHVVQPSLARALELTSVCRQCPLHKRRDKWGNTNLVRWWNNTESPKNTRAFLRTVWDAARLWIDALKKELVGRRRDCLRAACAFSSLCATAGDCAQRSGEEYLPCAQNPCTSRHVCVCGKGVRVRVCVSG